ncbi:MAG: pyruvate kinase [Elusimicrobiota bacterium]
MKKRSMSRVFRRVKIAATLGPVTSSKAMIERLARAGMDVVRLNFSHGTHESHARMIKAVRVVSKKIRRPMSVMADLQGPKIRTGRLAGGGPVSLEQGARFVLTTETLIGDGRRVSVGYRGFHKDVRKGQKILIGDGNIELQIAGVRGREVRCEVVYGGELSELKGISVPGAELRVPLLDAKDRRDLSFALAHGADYIAVSYVRSPRDVIAVRKLIKASRKKTLIIAKLEKAEALDRLQEILEVSDGVIVARGDLGVELPPEEVPTAQKKIIRCARELRIPVITATQMLGSMARSPRPTRAEASDVANAVFDGSSGLMLTDETAVGRYPVQSVEMMDRIIREAESIPSETWQPIRRGNSVAESIAEGVCKAADSLPLKCIAAFTETGRTARLIAHFRPRCPIIGFSPNQNTRRALALLWGVRPRKIGTVRDIDELARVAEWRLVEEGFARKGDVVGIVAGTPLSVAGTTNMLKLHVVGSAS